MLFRPTTKSKLGGFVGVNAALSPWRGGYLLRPFWELLRDAVLAGLDLGPWVISRRSFLIRASYILKGVEAFFWQPRLFHFTSGKVFIS